jgi:MFS family permease
MQNISFAKRLLNICSGCIGNLVEYFDWAIYAAFSLYFAPEFFPAGDQTAQLLNNAAVFAVGFIFRPLGGWVLGNHLVNTTGFSKDDATLISASGLLAFMVIQPLFGLLSDYIGRRNLLIAFGACATPFTTPLLNLLAQPQSLASALGWYICALLITSAYSSVNTIVKAELFPVHIRALGVGFPFAVTVAVFGGTAEYLALWLKSISHPEWFAYYVSACAACALLVALTMPESKAVSELDRD